MRIDRDMVPMSGLDFAGPRRHLCRPDESDVARPPRGHFYGGRYGRGYTFPALEPPGAIDELVTQALQLFAERTGVRAPRGRLRPDCALGRRGVADAHPPPADPDEVHTFDALYTDPTPLIEWARRRIAPAGGRSARPVPPGRAHAPPTAGPCAPPSPARCGTPIPALRRRLPGRGDPRAAHADPADVRLAVARRSVAADLPDVVVPARPAGSTASSTNTRWARIDHEVATGTRTTSQIRRAWARLPVRGGRMVPVRLLSHRTPVNPLAVDAFRALAAALTASGYRARSTWVYNCRSIAGSGGTSLHAYGLAVDIDPRHNPHRRGMPARSGSPRHRRGRAGPATSRPGGRGPSFCPPRWPPWRRSERWTVCRCSAGAAAGHIARRDALRGPADTRRARTRDRSGVRSRRAGEMAPEHETCEAFEPEAWRTETEGETWETEAWEAETWEAEGLGAHEGGPGKAARLSITFRIINRIHEPDTQVRHMRVFLRPTGSNVVLETGNGNTASRDLAGMVDGQFDVEVVPHDQPPAGSVTRLGNPASHQPNRLWLPYTATIDKQGNTFTVASDPDHRVTIAGDVITIRLTPKWMPIASSQSRGGQAATHIVVHHTDDENHTAVDDPAFGSLINRSITGWIGNSFAPHYVIDRDGSVIKLGHESAQAWHANPSRWDGTSDVNRFSIGIEIVHTNNTFRGHPHYNEEFTPEQYTALTTLLQDLTTNLDIDITNIIGHSDVGTDSGGVPITVVGRKSGDPGIKFDWGTVEAAGLGLRRDPGPVDFTTAYGGFFHAHPADSIRPGSAAAAITELRNDLTLIGYSLSGAAGYDDSVRRCIMVFGEHFLQRDGLEFVSRDVAEAIKRVVKFLQP